MSIKRELERFWQNVSHRFGMQKSDEQKSKQNEAPPRWMDSLRWLLLPLIIATIALLACIRLFNYTHPAKKPFVPVVLDAPLSNAVRLPFFSQVNSTYFTLRSEGEAAHLVASSAGPGTRAYRGDEVVPIFGKRAPSTDLYLSLCKSAPSQKDVLFYTGDGLILWLCTNAIDETRVELRRIGWRFTENAWQKGLRLGKAASNDLVLGSSMLPLHSLRLRKEGNQLLIQNRESTMGISKSQRLLCLTSVEAPKPEASSKKAPSSNAPTRKDTLDKKRKQAKKTKVKEKEEPAIQEAPKEIPCLQKDFRIRQGRYFRLHSRHHPHHGVTFKWQESPQEKGAFDLLLTPSDGKGISVRQLSFEQLQEQNKKGFLVGNAEMYFHELMPKTVRTLDVDEQVQELVLRGILQFKESDKLRTALSLRYVPQLELEQLLNKAQVGNLESFLKPLFKNPFLRNRIWMANQALAHDYRSQARSLFRLYFDKLKKENEVLGLGLGGATLRAPTRNILQPLYQKKKEQLPPRLATILTARDRGKAFLEWYDQKEKERPYDVYFLREHPLELLSSTTIPSETRQREFFSSSAVSAPRTLLWVGQKAYTSRHPFAYVHGRSNGSNGTEKTKPLPKRTPSRFLYRVKGRWWKRSPGLSRSSTEWPMAAIAERLGNLATTESLTTTLKQMNKGRWTRKRHCGRESRGRRHGQGCWGEQDLIRSGQMLLIPCSDAIQAKYRKRYCKVGAVEPKLDQEGNPMISRQASLNGMAGIVILPKNPRLLQGDAKQNKWYARADVTHVVRLLSNSLEVQLNDRPMQPNYTYPLFDKDRLQFGEVKLRYRRPTGILAHSLYRGDQIVSNYPEGPIFAHVVAGSVGGPYRSSSQGLKSQLPKPPASYQKGSIRKIATTLLPDLQRSAFAVAHRHFSRLDSEAFKKQFRRRYIRNAHQPHAGSVILLNRKTGQVLSALSFPALDPNRPSPVSNEKASGKEFRYLRGQLVDRFGISDGLLAYNPTRLPPDAPAKKRLEGKPTPIPNLLQALHWDKEEALRGVRGYSRSGWLIERAIGGAQTPGSTAKVVTAIAYARYLRLQGKPVRFPKHGCSGGMMFQVKRRSRRGKKVSESWRPTSIHFRCHKKGGHGFLTLKQALAVSCNVYFAKLALEMAGVPAELLRSSKVRWHHGRNSGSGRYEFVNIPRTTISEAMKKNPLHRILFKTASDLGFTMRYTYKIAKKVYGRYTDMFWEPGLPKWPKVPANLPKKQRRKTLIRMLRKRLHRNAPYGHFGTGRFFGFAAAYPAWQQWTLGTQEPRYQKPTSVHETFGSVPASLRGMAYVGFGQNLTISPLRIAMVSATIANGGLLPSPKLWIGDWKKHQSQPPTQDTRQTPRPKTRRILKREDAELIQKAMAAVTSSGTATKPFGRFNRLCLKRYGLQVIGKTGTAETRSAKSRKQLLKEVRKAGRHHYIRGSVKKWRQKSGCWGRRFSRYYYPEEGVADSLFMGSIVPTKTPAIQKLPANKYWQLRNLAFNIVVKNGYHPEGSVCRKKGQDLDRSEAKYLAHDILVALVQQMGACRDYVDTSAPNKKLTSPRRYKRRTRRTKRTRRARRTKRTRSRRTKRTRKRRSKPRRSLKRKRR